ncbi:sorbitol dehydrogenase-like [Teleopsis dalmanni]|uniref:sorbitol dehydrogenase-like n=1 Tax=Teleopsis dalmanni TaxID=139649 RepID=UPI0018CFB52C|nr:sorbitol dehydrogenase-like [Teleopsis dalmanni]
MVATAAIRRAKIEIGTEALILGCELIRLATLAALRPQKRLELARNMGANHTLLTTDKDEPSKLVKNIIIKMGNMPNRTFDCHSSEATTCLGIKATRSGGVLTLIGLAQNEMKLPIMEALSREVDIRGYPLALVLMASGNVNLKPLITYHFDLEETEKAFKTVECRIENPIKVMIQIQPRDTNNKEPFKSNGDCV